MTPCFVFVAFSLIRAICVAIVLGGGNNVFSVPESSESAPSLSKPDCWWPHFYAIAEAQLPAEFLIINGCVWPKRWRWQLSSDSCSLSMNYFLVSLSKCLKGWYASLVYTWASVLSVLHIRHCWGGRELPENKNVSSLGFPMLWGDTMTKAALIKDNV